VYSVARYVYTVAYYVYSVARYVYTVACYVYSVARYVYTVAYYVGWWLAQYGEFTGWVPASYLDPVYNPSDNEDEALSAVPALPCKYVTTSDYVAAEGDELSIARGCVVDVITKAIDGWWTCRYRIMRV